MKKAGLDLDKIQLYNNNTESIKAEKYKETLKEVLVIMFGLRENYGNKNSILEASKLNGVRIIQEGHQVNNYVSIGIFENAIIWHMQ